MSDIEDIMALRPRFGSHRELLNHLFHNKGVEVALVKQLTHANNVGMLTEIVCFILDRPQYPDHVATLEPGSRCAELATINYLGINHGYRNLDDQYQILFYLFSLSKPPEMIDFFRILRSRTNWTSSDFRTAIQTSPLHTYTKHVVENLVQVTAARRYFFTLAYVVNLAFASGEDNLNRWLHTEQPDANILNINPAITPETHYQSIEHIYNELFRNGIGGVNVDLYKTMVGPNSVKLRSYPEDNAKYIEVKENSPAMPLAARSAFARYETFALSYLSIFSNDYEIARLQAEIKAGVTANRKAEIEKMLKGFEYLKQDYHALFTHLLDQFGIDLCAVNEVIAVYICAKVYGDKEIQDKISKMAGINDSNMWTYTHQQRLPHLKDSTLLADLPELTKNPDNVVKSMLEFFIRRNLIKGAEFVVAEQKKPLQDLAGESNFIGLTASTAVAHPSTVQWLIKQKAKLCSNSKQGTKYNVFVCCLFSLGSPESRLEIMKEAYDFVTRNPAFKPEVTVEEFFEGVKMSWTSAMWDQPGTSMRLDLLSFVLNNVVNKTQWEKLRTTPGKYLTSISAALPPEAFMLSDFTMYDQSLIDNFHNEMLGLFKLILPPEVGPYVTEEAHFKRIMQHAITTKNVKLFEYFLSFNPKIEMNDIIGLSQSSSSSFDYRDLFLVPSPIYQVQNPDSETAQAERQFQVVPFQLSSCEEVFGELLDFDYCDHATLLKYNINPEQPVPPEAKQFIQGAAAKAGVRQIDWDAFGAARQQEDPDISIIGGEGNDKDGVLDVYSDEAMDDSYLETDEFNSGIQFLLSLFASNNANPVPLRSPFVTMLEMMYKRCGTMEGPNGETSDSAQEFGRYWLDLSNSSIPIVTSHHLLWTLIRHMFPNRAVDFSVTSQFLAATATTAFMNKRVWIDDFVFDYLIEIVGCTDHKQIGALHDQFQQYLAQNDSSNTYIQDRTPQFCPSKQMPVGDMPTNMIWNLQQWVFTHKPFKPTKMAENLIISLVLSIAVGYISVIGSQKHQAQQRYMQEATRAQKRGQPLPPPPPSFVQPSMYLDSSRMFVLLFQQIKWLPQLLLKLMVAQFEIINVSVYGDLFDLFIATGGQLIDEKVDCRLPPASYPIMIPPEKADKFYGYYEFVVTSNGLDLDKVQAHVEAVVSRAQSTIDQHENAHSGPTRRHHEGPTHKESGKSSSASSYILPVILGVGAALAGLAGFVYFSSQADDDDDNDEVVTEKPKAVQRKKQG